MNILVTGASGFVGRGVCKALSLTKHNGYALLRRPQEGLKVKKQFIVEDFLSHSDWEAILKGMDVVIHTAGLAHVKRHPAQNYCDINTEITKKLALECVKAGVKRFVFISTVSIYGVSSSQEIISLLTPYNPITPYGQSKLLAENFLQELYKVGTIETVIIRPPIVYGPAAPGNVQTLLKAIRKGIPLPFAATQNRRSMVFIENLADALLLCATHPKAKGNTYFVSDGRPVSIGELITGLARGMGEKARLFYFPDFLIRTPLKLLGKEEILEKITGSLQLDISDIQKTLGWKPIISVEEALERTGQSFRSTPATL